MALPPVPSGYNSWNQYIEEQGAVVAAAQDLTFQEGKASVKLGLVAEPERRAFGTPSYRIYNTFVTWADRTVAPTEGRPWLLASDVAPEQLVTQSGDTLTTQAGDVLLTQ